LARSLSASCASAPLGRRRLLATGQALTSDISADVRLMTGQVQFPKPRTEPTRDLRWVSAQQREANDATTLRCRPIAPSSPLFVQGLQLIACPPTVGPSSSTSARSPELPEPQDAAGSSWERKPTVRPGRAQVQGNNLCWSPGHPFGEWTHRRRDALKVFEREMTTRRMVSTALCRLINVVSVGERLMTTQRRFTNAHEDTNASVHQFFFRW